MIPGIIEMPIGNRAFLKGVPESSGYKKEKQKQLCLNSGHIYRGLKMNKKLFRAIFGTSLTVLLLSIVMIFGVLLKYFTNLQFKELKSETGLAAKAVELNGLDYLKDIDADNIRVTWIASDGSLLFDNKADIAQMENHLEREEIRSALETGFGESSRYSSTLDKKCLYTAERLSDASIIRLSTTQDTVWMLLLGLTQPLCVTAFTAIVLSLVLSAKLTGKENDL